MNHFGRSLVALVTPFDNDGNIDYSSLASLIDWQIACGSDGIIIGGTTGEAPTLSEEEFIELIHVAREVISSRIPLIVGCGTNSTSSTLERCANAKKFGADAALVIVPYYNRPSFEGIYAHFSQVGQLSFPFIFYHHPLRTSITLSSVQIAQICSIRNVCGYKEGSGDLKLMSGVKACSQVPIYTGDDGAVLDAFEIGAYGVISAVANVLPEEMYTLVDSYHCGDIEQARAIERGLLGPISALLAEVNPQGIKYGLSLLGRINPTLRLPLILPTKDTRERVVRELELFSVSKDKKKADQMAGL